MKEHSTIRATVAAVLDANGVDKELRREVLAPFDAKRTPKAAPLVSPTEFARLKSVSTVTVRRWIREGRVQVERLTPRTIRVRPDSFTEAPAATVATPRDRKGQFTRSR